VPRAPGFVRTARPRRSFPGASADEPRSIGSGDFLLPSPCLFARALRVYEGGQSLHRSPRVVFAWVLAALVAIATARVVGGDLASLHQRARALGPNVQVVLAQRDLSLGRALDASDVRVVSRPAETVPSDALRVKQDVNGRVLRVSIFRDDVVRAVDLAPLARNGIDGLVPVGRRAVHVVLKDGFRPRVGAVVDVLASADPTVAASSPANAGRAVTVAQGAIVVGLDDPGEAGSAGGSAVTVLVTAVEAPAVAFAAANGQVTIALAPPEDACCTS